MRLTDFAFNYLKNIWHDSAKLNNDILKSQITSKKNPANKISLR